MKYLSTEAAVFCLAILYGATRALAAAAAGADVIHIVVLFIAGAVLFGGAVWCVIWIALRLFSKQYLTNFVASIILLLCCLFNIFAALIIVEAP